eukprot:jgi/Psemu1/7736/gm1.7736_g
MPARTAFDWNQIQDIAIQFGPFNTKDNAHKHEDFNKSFARNLEYTDGLFITDDDAEGPKTLAPDPVTMLREIIVTAIMDILPSKEQTAVNKGHISRLFADATFWYVAPNQSKKSLQNKHSMDKAGELAIKNGQATILIEIRATHWGFKPDWDAIHFAEVYDTNIYSSPKQSNTRKATTVADKTPNASRARFANIPQRTYIKPKAVPLQRKHIQPRAVPPNTAILTVPIKPVESEAHTATQVPSSCVTSSSATTDLLTNKMIHSDVVATPSNTTASIPPVTANLGPLQPVGPIADTPSIKAPHYIWTWTYSPDSESVSFRRVCSGSISFQRATSSSPPVHRQDKSPPCEPTNFQWTFNPQSETVVFHRLPKPAPIPLKPSLQLPLPKANHVGIIHASASPTFAKHSAYPPHFCCAISSNTNQAAFCITKRHRDVLKIKMYHLYANILLMNWFYDTFD